MSAEPSQTRWTSIPIPFAQPDITEAEISAVAAAMRSHWLTTGPGVQAFEDEFARFVDPDDPPIAVAVNSATAGLHLSYEALGIGPGDEVLVPTWTFTATAEAVRYLGAEVRFVDVDPETLCLDLAAAEAAISNRTTAIAPVHFAGLPIANDALTALARRHGLAVIEDAAHAFPTLNQGRLVGSHGHPATVFSFYATKTMTTGEGGMVLTRDEAVAQRMRTMRLHGISRDVFDRYTSTRPSWHYEVVAPGYKYNLTDTAAEMGRVQLTRAADMAARRASIAEQYDRAFADLPLQLPAHAAADSSHAWHLYVVRLSEHAPLDRDRFIVAMSEAGIGTSVHFIPLHLQPYWRTAYQLEPGDFPVATQEFSRVVSLPIFSSMTPAQVDRVIDVVRGLLA